MPKTAQRTAATETRTSPPPLPFATGPADQVASILESSSRAPARLTTDLAESLLAELHELATVAAHAAAEPARAFLTAVAGLDGGLDQFAAQTLTSLLVFDGLVAPAVRRLAFGDEPPASVIVVDSDGDVPFRRACVRPGNQEVAAAFCCDSGLSSAADLHGIFSDEKVRRAVGSVKADGSILIDEPAKRQLNRIAALDERAAYAEYSVRSALPSTTPEELTSLRMPALTLAESILRSAQTPQRLADNLRTAGTRVLPGFLPQDAIEVALGVFHHGVARTWYEQGIWTNPPQYRLLDAEGRRVGSLFIVSIDA